MSRATDAEPNGWLVPEWTVTVSASTDADLVSAAAAGSREAFDALVVRHQRAVYHLCRRYAANHEEAADLAQDVFVRAFRNLRQFRGESAFKTWLHRIAVNVCLNRVSARAPRLDRMEPLEALDVTSAATGNRDDGLVREEQARAVRAAIAKLPPKQRATLILRVYQEMSHEEIARVLGSSVGACKANLFHALKKLRELLKP